MRTRDVVRHIPPFSRYVKYIETLEGTLSQYARRVETLEGTLSQVVFSDVASLVEADVEDEDGVPIPGAALRFMVIGESDPDRFLHWGKRGAQLVSDLLAGQGKRLDQVGKILDLGCGCGRVIRHLRCCGAEELHGCDCNAKAIAWCQRFLDFATFHANNLEPPLPYPDAMFGLIYAYSIFTHLPERLQLRWMDEIRRVLAPGGYFLLTVHGRRFIDSQGPAERAAFERGELVVVGERLAGSNSCAAFHPERYVREILARGFEVVDKIVEGAEACGLQDVYLLRLPG
jgi:SAM-dependent methyltransferase